MIVPIFSVSTLLETEDRHHLIMLVLGVEAIIDSAAIRVVLVLTTTSGEDFVTMRSMKRASEKSRAIVFKHVTAAPP